ncbi:glycerate kinase [Diaminobutyricimonas sp. TR449]|uniref:glycerate kinase n=1 Tax=Diaminobutyricimonas sp. TR449 TaxID=2708076 RepID=UPI00141F0113|nr:glycerate kinase [Diaminobutyricimonas sp. TR449]
MRIVIAPDKFKGSLDAAGVARHIADGLRSVDPTLTIDEVPAADGGEGTLDAAIASGFTRHSVTVTGPLGEPVNADFAVGDTVGVVELATASGLALIPEGRRDAGAATSRGTGELIAAALDLGCETIVLAIGGSASTDAGAGMLAGLGVVLLDARGDVVPDGGRALAGVTRIDLSRFDTRVASTRFVLASDVDNVLLGPTGAAAVFGPQKGATAKDVAELDAALGTFSRVLADAVGPVAADAVTGPGAGAAGGVGYAALAVLGAERRPGIEVVLNLTGLPHSIQGADLVITGEGSLDEQSLGGKTPIGVADAARRASVPVIAVCGRSNLGRDRLREAGFERTFAITDYEADPMLCMTNAGALLERIGAEIGSQLTDLVKSPRPREPQA